MENTYRMLDWSAHFFSLASMATSLGLTSLASLPTNSGQAILDLILAQVIMGLLFRLALPALENFGGNHA